MQYTRDSQRKLGYHRLKLRTVFRCHLIAAAHGADRRIELAPTGVFKLLSRLKQRLMPDYAKAAHFLNPCVSVGDDPVTRNQLCRNGANILDGYGVSENVVFFGGSRIDRQ